MAVVMEVVGLRSIAEKLQGHWEVVAGSGQRMRGGGLGCKRVEVRLRRRCWQEAGSCEEEHILAPQGLAVQR